MRYVHHCPAAGKSHDKIISVFVCRCALQVWSGVRHSDGHGGFDAEINTTDAPVIVVGANSYDPNGAIGADVEAHPGKFRNHTKS